MFTFSRKKFVQSLVLTFLLLFMLSHLNSNLLYGQEPTPAPADQEELVYYPMPMPEWKPPESEGNEENLVHYSLETFEERTEEPIGNSSGESSETSPGFANVLFPQIDENSFPQPQSFTDLSLIENPSPHPWSVNVKLFTLFTDNNNNVNAYVCSGTLIDAKHVITAGHCIYSHENGEGWADSVRVVAAFDEGDEPYGDSNAVWLHSWTGWTSNENFDWDMGYIELDRPIGALSGWHGFGFDDDNDFFDDNTFHNPGYPAESPYDGQSLYYWYGTYDDVNTHTLYHNKRGYGGQSGSGTYYWDGGSGRWVYAVHSHTTDGGTGDAGQTRINSDRFDSILGVINDNTPSTRDLIALDVNAFPEQITAGSNFSTLNFFVHNYSSSSWNGRVDFDVYLSTNDFISTADVLIGEGYFDYSFGSKSSVRVNLPLYDIPITLNGGSYWVGVIIDSSDADTTNNVTHEWDAAPISVNQFVPSAPTNLQASDGIYTARTRVSWNSTYGAVDYHIYRATSVNGSKTYLGNTSSTVFNDYTIALGTDFYYFVRAEAANGRLSGFSNSDSGWALPYKIFIPFIGN